MSRILFVLFLVGCTQTDTVVLPANASCYAECAPGGKCYAEFESDEEVNIEESVLLGTADEKQETEQ